MTNITKTIIAAALAAFTAAPAAALETHLLNKSGNWETELEVYSGGDLACSSKSRLLNADLFGTIDITLTQGGVVQVWMFFSSPADVDYEADVQVEIDGKRWTMRRARVRGDGKGSSIFFDFSDNDKAVLFLEDVRNGRLISLAAINNAPARFSWSLKGSGAAMSALADCFIKISSEGL